MSCIKHIKGPFQKTAEEAKSLTQDEYLQLEELFKRFKESRDGEVKAMLILDINQYVERFPVESKVVFYYENWAKKAIESDSYMSLILNLHRLSDTAYGQSFFKTLL